MRVALTRGTLQVPPTYFAVQHALRMPDIDWHVFDLVSDVTDPDVSSRLEVTDAVPTLGALPRRVRERLVAPAMGRMAHQVEDWSPDVIHQHAATWALPAVWASRRSGAPLVTTLHGADAYGGTLPGTALLSRARARWMAHNLVAAAEQSRIVLAVSRYLADVAMHSGVPADRLEVHHQGVDTDWFTPGDTPDGGAGAGVGGNAAPGAPDTGMRTLLFVGALSVLKGVRELLAVSEDLAPHLPHRLVIVGDGPLAPEVREATRRLPHVTWTGALGREGVREHMRSADALVLPTRHVGGRAEAAGLVLLEAQACGTPVVVNAVGGTPEMMVEGATGFSTDEGDSDSLRRAVSLVLTLPADELADMGRAARSWVCAHRSLAGSVDQLREVYRQVTEGRDASR